MSDLLDRGRTGVARIPGKRGDAARSFAVVQVVIADRPGELARLFGAARFVHVVRDGRMAAFRLAETDWGPDDPVAGILLFHVTAQVAYTFYICRSERGDAGSAIAFLIADLLDRLPARGVRHLDLGPSASDLNFNDGVVFFKEGMGGVGACRNRWRWQAGDR